MIKLEDIDEVIKDYQYNKDERKIIINELNFFLYDEFCKREKYTLSGDYKINDLYMNICENLNKSYYFGLPRYSRSRWNTKHIDNNKVNNILKKHNIPFEIVNIKATDTMLDEINPTYQIFYTGEFERIAKYDKRGLMSVFVLDFVYTVFNEASKCLVIDNDFAETIDILYSKLCLSHAIGNCVTRSMLNSLSFWNNEFFKIFNMPFNITVTIMNGHKWYNIIRTDNI